MYIQPNSNVHIFHDVPLCESYEDTMDFSSKAQQWSYFADNYYKYGLTKYYYQRASVNSIKVEKKYEDLYDCNYMAFNNISYENKVFYAFIKELKYINDNVTEIVYEIDPLQTWMFDYQLGQCFVEREHTRDDAIGANLVPENLETGEYDYHYCYASADSSIPVNGAADLRNLCVVVFATIDEDYNNARMGDFDGSMYNGLYPVYKVGNDGSPMANMTFDLNDTGMDALSYWMSGVPASLIDSIHMAVIMPKNFLTGTSVSGKFIGEQNIMENTSVLRADGTPVRNNKCLCFPYNCLYVSNNQGKYAIYPYEYFSTLNGACRFYIYGDRTPNPSYLLAPRNYKGISVLQEEGISISNYPQVSLNVDAFKAWLAQNAGGLATSALTMVYTQQIGNPNRMEYTEMNKHYSGEKHWSGYGPSESAIGMGGNILKYGGIHGVISGVVNGTLANFKAPQSLGTQSGSMNVSAGLQNFYFYNRRIKPEFATIIDDYFQMFGYACHKVKTPTAHNRIKWDYVKTVGCVVHGQLPSDEAERIKQIYDNGVRFWHYGATMYDYDTANNTVL